MHTLIRKQSSALILSAVLCVGICVGIISFFRIMHERVSRVILAKERIASYEVNKKLFAEESKQLARIDERTRTLEEYRVTEAQVPELLSSLEAHALENHIELSITAVQAPTVQNKSLTINLSARGALTALESFLTTLTHQSYQVRIDNFSLNTTTATSLLVPQGQKVTPTPTTPLWELVMSVQIVS